MKKKFLIIFSIVITFFIFLVAKVSASSPFVIGKEKAGSYQYTVVKEENNFTWKISHRDNLSTIQENSDNTEDLEHFRIAVEDINKQIFEIIITASYLLFVVLTVLILYKKNRQTLKSDGAIFAILIGISLFITLKTSIELNTAFQDAKFYYSVLTK